MDWDLLLEHFPLVCRHIFDYVDIKTLKKCPAVCQNWHQYLGGSKFYWIRSLAEINPEWNKLLKSSIKSETVSALVKCFHDLRDKSFPRDVENNTHPIFCSIQLDDIETFQSLTSLWPDYEILWFRLKMYRNHHAPVFHFAAANGCAKLTKYFMDVGMEERRNPDGYSDIPLDFAALFGQLEIVKIFLDNIKGKSHSNILTTPMHYAVWGRQNDYLEVVKLLMENIEGDKNPPDGNGMTPLHLATYMSGDLDVAKVIIDNIDIGNCPRIRRGDFPGIMEKNIILDAVMLGRIEIARLLLESFELDELLFYEGYTPLHAASEMGNVEMVKLLLRKMTPKIHPTLYPDDGKTPFDIAKNEEIRNIFMQEIIAIGNL